MQMASPSADDPTNSVTALKDPRGRLGGNAGSACEELEYNEGGMLTALVLDHLGCPR